MSDGNNYLTAARSRLRSGATVATTGDTFYFIVDSFDGAEAGCDVQISCVRQ